MSRPPFDLTTLPCTAEDLRECYLEKRMSSRAIAVQFGISVYRVRGALKVLDLPIPAERTGADQPGHALERYYAAYQKSALARSHVFALTQARFAELVSQPCSYCGIAPAKKVGVCFFSGIDRIDCHQGYVEGNVQPCCGTCNLAKQRMSEQAFIAWVLRAADHLRGSGCASPLQTGES